jgi:hypothetical protein
MYEISGLINISFFRTGFCHNLIGALDELLTNTVKKDETMKNFKLLQGLLALHLIGIVNVLSAQDMIHLGKNKDVLSHLNMQGARMSGKTNNVISLPVSDKESLNVAINVHHQQDGKDTYIGAVENEKNSIFFLTGNALSLKGNVILKDKGVAYRYSSDKSGNTFVEKINPDKLICTTYEPFHSQVQYKRELDTLPAGHASHLQSLPGADAVVLLDFDGQYVEKTFWNNGDPINAAPSGMDASTQTEIWEMVSEDYQPFQINITTDEAVYLKAAPKNRTRCIFTPTTTAAPGQAGVSYVGSFSWGNETPCWVFNTGVKGAGEAAAHEIGHTLGLAHDGREIPQEQYYSGQGDWAPIMGAGYYFPITQWSKGEYLNANNTENDIDIITTGNGFGYKTDDFGNTPSTAAPILGDAKGVISQHGIIEKEGDEDVFLFKTSGGLVHINVVPALRHANLNPKITLTDINNKVIATGSPSGLKSDLSVVVNSGTYYINVSGQGSGDPTTNGYSKYGSMGAYSIGGTLPGYGTVLSTESVLNMDNSTTLLSVFPNPAKEKAIIKINSASIQNITIELTDLSSHKIVTQEEEIIRGLNELEINLDNIENGTYLVTVLHADKKEIRKLIVIK